MGNRLSKVDTVSGTLTTTTYAYNSLNRLDKLNGVHSYTNDPNGNTLASPAPSGGTRTNVWDTENRLISCTANGTNY